MCGNSVNSVQLYRKLTNNITAIMYCYNIIKSEMQLHVATVYMYIQILDLTLYPPCTYIYSYNTHKVKCSCICFLHCCALLLLLMKMSFSQWTVYSEN